MAGIYEMIGDDKNKIVLFYENLGRELENVFKQEPGLKKLLKTLEIPRHCKIPETEPYSIPLNASEYPQVFDPSWVAFLMIKEQESGFYPFSYRHINIKANSISYSDCFETALRNIACALAYKGDKPFHSSIFSPKFKTFFEEYKLMSLQKTNEAYSKFAELINECPYLLYKTIKEDYRYEIQTSFINLLASLNFILDFQIEDFTKYEISLDAANAEKTNNLLKKYFRL